MLNNGVKELFLKLIFHINFFSNENNKHLFFQHIHISIEFVNIKKKSKISIFNSIDTTKSNRYKLSQI